MDDYAIKSRYVWRQFRKTTFPKRPTKGNVTIHTIIDANSDKRYNSHFAGYGLGRDLRDIKGNLNVSHTGGLPAMLS
jgi:hypothetical protein